MKQLVLNKLSYDIENTLVKFEEFITTFSSKRYGLIGENGIGKSTLLKLMTGEIQPHSGSLQCTGNILFMPQHYRAEDTETVAAALGIDAILDALSKVANGDVNPENFDIIGSEWDIQDKTAQLLNQFDLGHIQTNTLFKELSGGQQTKILIIKAILSTADFILFDEPTNNLDSHSRELLYEFIKNTKKGIIIVSHDRTLLNLMDEIIELTGKGLTRHTGNYQHFQEQKQLSNQALQHQLDTAKKTIKKAKRAVQENREKFERRKSKGVKAARSGNMDKQTALSKKGRSEKTASRMSTLEDRLIENAEAFLTQAKSQIEFPHELNIDLSSTHVPNGKVVVSIEDLKFRYSQSSNPIINKFNLKIVGPERLGLTGKNGSGKTTFVKLLCGKLKPTSGNIEIGVKHVSYLDQHVRDLVEDKTLLENFQQFNPDATTEEAHRALAAFKFRNKQAKKIVSNLSGGQKVRAGLACMLLSKTPPQLIILDEPTNHLDIKSIECIESALRDYEGAVIVITHDNSFLENIGVNRTINFSS